eukprot:TRINITY_DN5966_c1_g1_i2.p1 TRINITY_DN5966_c1_g1~~TRINITY_DN5966_c1_g1_i2.p1  ORF type:complete len:1231 (+),score=486.41 TRINITY_DN5966_c1_g1_i2:84-3695(+)
MGGVAKDDEKLNRDLCKPGCKVFYWEPEHAWSLGTVTEDTGKHFAVTGAEYCATKKGALQACDKLTDDKIWPAREDVLDEDCDDLLNLTVLHDATIQRCLYVRYMKDVVYTFIGQIVVALNPWNFKIPHYVDAKMPDYLREGEVIKENLPHSWAQAHNTWYDLRRDSENQTILISGESGAGKTEAAKIVMKYLGSLSCLHGTEATKDAAKQVAFNINQASPVLEGFGNAKTVRNDNSSRFGKFMKVQFDGDGVLVGAFTIKYLLEKSRIVTASPNERVYHAFYLLVKGKDAGKYSATKPAAEYHCNAGKCVDIPGVDDGEDYSLCLDAMTNCGFDDAQKDGVWRVVGGIVQAMQVAFKAKGDECELEPSSVPASEACCSLWQVDAAKMRKEMVETQMKTRDGIVTRKLNKDKAKDNLEACVKSVYDELFGWQVEQINRLTDTGGGQNFIGLLDIFGFEDFELNSFEQICINLANETLQNHYNSYIFRKDMDECRAEGIDTADVQCPDNMPCLNMLNQKTGILGLLDDSCKMQTGTDADYLKSVIEGHSKNPFFATARMAKDTFIVKHYAADVTYTVRNWREKNMDTLKPEMKHLMRASAQPLIASLIKEPDEEKKTQVFVGGYFKEQLGQLMALINSTNPHWIRCVKPHPAKKPLMVDGITMMKQLESSGVLGTVKIRKAGFPVRIKYDKFVVRFKCMLSELPPPRDATADVKAYCSKVVAAAGIEPLRAQCGSSMMFLKNDANQQLELFRERAMKRHYQCLWAHGRSKLSEQRRRGRLRLWAARLVQSEARDFLVRSAAAREEKKRREEAERKAREELERRLEQERREKEKRERELAEARRKREEEERRKREERMAETREAMAVRLQCVVRGWLYRLSQYREYVEQMRAQVEEAIEESVAQQHRRAADLDDRRRRAEDMDRKITQLAKERAARLRKGDTQRVRSAQAASRWEERRRQIEAAAREREQHRERIERRERIRLAGEQRERYERDMAERRRENERRRKELERAAEEARERGERLRRRWDEQPRSEDISRAAQLLFAEQAAQRARSSEQESLVGPAPQGLPPRAAAAERQRRFAAACLRYDAQQEWEATREQRVARELSRERKARRHRQQRAALAAAQRYTSPPPPLSPGGLNPRQLELEELHGRRLEAELAYQQQYASRDTLDALVALRERALAEARRRRKEERRRLRETVWEEDC